MTGQPTSLENLAERLRTVKVGVRAELEVSRHLFSGQPAYVVRDPITFQSHKLTPADYQVFVAINANEELHRTFVRLQDANRLEADQEEDFYRFILHLSQLGLLTLPMSDGSALYGRFVRRRAKERRAKILGILFLRVPLIQPDAFLDRTLHYFSLLFTRAAFVLWFIGLVVCSCLIASRWHEFRSPLGTILAIQNLPVLWSLLVILKIVHEFGHAYACKHFGGRVPEMGAYFIVFTPCAYVDASASWGFPNPIHRVIVALGGMYVESIAAMLAVLIWCFTEPGLVHSAAQYAIVLSTIVTIGFNANPLMKYDGYYILSDLLRMPNLRTDAQRQVTDFLKRLCFGVRPPASSYSLAARALMTIFGVASSLYKVVVVLGISIMIAFKVPAAGIGLAVFYIGNTLWQMASTLLRYLASPEIARVRRRAITVMSAGAIAAIAIVFIVPVPGTTRALGVLQRFDEHMVRAVSAGFLYQAGVKEGQHVSAGTVICELENVDVTTAVDRKEAELTQLRIQMQREVTEDLNAAAATEQLITQTLREKEQIERDRDQLTIRSPAAGNIIEAEALRDIGRYVRKGEPVAAVSDGPWVIRALFTAEGLSSSIPKVGDPVQIRFVGDARESYAGEIIHVAKAGSRTIDETALTHLGGGDIPVATETMEAAHPFFQITVGLKDSDDLDLRYGLTAWIQLPEDHAPIGLYLYRQGLNLLNQLRMAG